MPWAKQGRISITTVTTCIAADLVHTGAPEFSVLGVTVQTPERDEVGLLEGKDILCISASSKYARGYFWG